MDKVNLPLHVHLSYNNIMNCRLVSVFNIFSRRHFYRTSSSICVFKAVHINLSCGKCYCSHTITGSCCAESCLCLCTDGIEVLWGLYVDIYH